MYSLDRSIIDACHARLRDGSRTFLAASYLLPRRVREPAAALYAFCRVADDAIDQGENASRSLQSLRLRLDAIYQQRDLNSAEDQAFASVVHHFGIPRELPDALLEGFEWDIEQRDYRSLDELHAYSARVAGTVGSMMAMIMGVRDPLLVARACELGMAMQLSNIARDVGEDARNGRLYLPREWMEEAGIDAEAWLAEPRFSPQLATVIQRLLDVADELYLSADSGIASLPLDCRMGIRSARLIYCEIGRQLERQGLDSISARAIVPASAKLKLIGRALTESQPVEAVDRQPVLESSRFLIDAVANSTPGHSDLPFVLPASWWQVKKQMLWTMDLFQRLHQRDRVEETRNL
jgi:phytoene synthase